MMKQHNNKDQNYRRIKITSQFSGLDIFLIKKPSVCTIRIPDTIFLDRNGAPRDWIFNSNKVPHHPILKKRRQNLHTITVIKSFCSKFIPNSSIANIKNINELKQTVQKILIEKKDAQFSNKKKSIQITTINNGILPLTILQFLDYIGNNKNADQSFYQKWKMIQERISHSKHEQYYRVQSVRNNHLIQSKSSKITLLNPNHNRAQSYDMQGQMVQTLPSVQIQPNEKGLQQGFKFFDTYLNKKFFSSVQILIQCIQKNYKCLVESIKTRFAIDSNRDPHLIQIQEIYVKPINKLFNMRYFKQCILNGQIKLDSYVRCLNQFIIETNISSEPNLEQPLYQQKKYKCRGQFCNVQQRKSQNLQSNQQNIKLPFISGSFNSRKVSSSLVECVSKKTDRVIQRLKQAGIVDMSYIHQKQSDSQYDENDQAQQPFVKVCQNCFIFYLNAMKFFELDAYGSLSQRKSSRSAYSKTPHSGRKKSHTLLQEDQNQHILMTKHKQNIKSLKNLREKTNKQLQGQTKQSPKVARSISMATRLKALKSPIQKLNKKTEQQQLKQKIAQKSKQKSIDSNLNKKSESKYSKLIQAKLKSINNISQKMIKPTIEVKPVPVKTFTKNTKPKTYQQALEQAIYKLQNLPYSNEQQYIIQAKKYYKNNLPQLADRYQFSNNYQNHLYQFMNNTIIAITPANKIKKRPQMSLKRLSQLTNYPQIVSRSAFVFDTLICDQKTTIPFCVISSKMIHNNNVIGKPYKNIFIFQDIFDSYIEHISMTKELLDDLQNTRFILFNYPGQSHTIYDKNGQFRTTEFIAIVDKLLFRLATLPNQLGIIGKEDTIQLVGFGYGGYLLQSYLSACPSTYNVIKGALIINSSLYCTKKHKEIFESLINLYQLQDTITQQNAFLFYNKAINSSQITNQDMQNKAGLNSIRTDGRVYLMKNALSTWDYTSAQHFQHYQQKVILVIGKQNILITKLDMQKLLIKTDHEKTAIKNRKLIQLQGGHDILAQNYEGITKILTEFIRSQ